MFTLGTKISVEIKKLPHYVHPSQKLPSYVTTGSAGIDLTASVSYPTTIQANQVSLIPTGIALNINQAGVMFVLCPKSGLGHKKGLILGNTVGIVDSDYQGEIFVSVWNRRTSNIFGYPILMINPGDFICQGIFVPYLQADFKEVDEFSINTDRGALGFGKATETFSV